MFEHLLCDTSNINRILHRCENFPGIEKLEEFLKNQLYDEVDYLTSKQGLSTDRTTLTENSATSVELSERAIKKKTKQASNSSFYSKT